MTVLNKICNTIHYHKFYASHLLQYNDEPIGEMARNGTNQADGSNSPDPFMDTTSSSTSSDSSSSSSETSCGDDRDIDFDPEKEKEYRSDHELSTSPCKAPNLPD